MRRKRKRVLLALSRDDNDNGEKTSPLLVNKINLEEMKWLEREREAREQWEMKQNLTKVIEEIKPAESHINLKDIIKTVVQVPHVKLPFDLPYHNPFEPDLLDQSKREICHFFRKTGVCRFDLRCSRLHETPLVSDTIVFINMFMSNSMEMSMAGGDPDLSLESDENELINEYNEFYADIEKEFLSFGQILAIRTCRNAMRHLRGNVYVQYRNINDAVYAYSQLTGRYYAGNQLITRFVTIDSWRESICGLYFKGKCPKGGICNFMHILLNKGESSRDLYHFLNQSRTLTISRRSFKCRHRSRTCSSIDGASTPEMRRLRSPQQLSSDRHKRRHRSFSRKKQKSHRSDKRRKSPSPDHHRHHHKRKRHKN